MHTMPVATTTTTTRRAVLGALLGLAASPVLAYDWSFGGNTVEGRGRVTRQARRVQGFSGVAMELSGRVEVRIGSDEDVTVETEENLQQLIETDVEDGVLRIRAAKRRMNLRTRNLHIVVTARQIDRLSLGGSGSIETDALRARRLEIELGGSGRIDLGGVEADTMSVSVGGSADLRCGDGKVRKLSVAVAGSGDVDVARVAAQEASASISGSGDVTLWAARSLNVSIAGSGDVKYYGDPQLRRSIAGAGDARRIAAAPR